MSHIRYLLLSLLIMILALNGCSTHISTIEEAKAVIASKQHLLHPHDNESIKLFWSLKENLDELGQAYSLVGDYALSLEAFQEALKIRKRSSGSLQKEIANNYNSIGFIYDKLGNFSKALENYKQALIINKRSKNEDYQAINYNNIGLIHVQIGDFNTSLDYYDKALKIYKRLDQQRNISIAYNNIGFTYENMGFLHNDIDAQLLSIDYYEKALSISDTFCEQDDNSCRLSARLNNNLGFAYNRLGGYDEALSHTHKALSIQKKLFGEHHFETAVSHNNLGLIYEQMGLNNPDDESEQRLIEYFQQALHHHRLALAIREETYGTKHQITGMSYLNIAKVHEALHHNEQYYLYLKRSFDIFMQDRDRHFTIMTNLQKFNYLRLRNEEVAELLRATYLLNNEHTLANKTKNSKRLLLKMFDDWLNYKGTVFDLENTISMLYYKSDDKKTKATIDRLNQKKRYLAELYQNSILKQVDEITIKQTEDEISRLESLLSSKIRQYQEELDLQKITTKDLVRTIGADELYMDYVHTKYGYYLFTLDHQQNITFQHIDIETSEEIDTAIVSFKNIIQNIPNSDKTVKEINSEIKNIKEPLSMLYELLIKDRIQDKHSLTISPDGLLNTVPFEAFYDEEDARFLIEAHTIHYIPSGKELLRLSKQSKGITKEQIVIFADPDFNDDAVEQTPTKEHLMSTRGSSVQSWKTLLPFNALPGTKQEANDLQIAYQENVTVFTQQDASAKNLLSIKSPTILHLATHGFFIDDRLITNPLLRSGIALSGANNALDNHSNGIVLGLELAGLDLESTELVVLSACETGVGDLNEAEGVAGLNKAFIMAGTKHIIMTLWSISDRHSAELIKMFYANTHIEDYENSLQKAKLKMIKEGLHPYFWSPFILYGL